MIIIDPDCLACAACYELVGSAEPAWVPGVGWCCPGCAGSCANCGRRTRDVRDSPCRLCRWLARGRP